MGHGFLAGGRSVVKGRGTHGGAFTQHAACRPRVPPSPKIAHSLATGWRCHSVSAMAGRDAAPLCEHGVFRLPPAVCSGRRSRRAGLTRGAAIALEMDMRAVEVSTRGALARGLSAPRSRLFAHCVARGRASRPRQAWHGLPVLFAAGCSCRCASCCGGSRPCSPRPSTSSPGRFWRARECTCLPTWCSGGGRGRLPCPRCGPAPGVPGALPALGARPPGSLLRSATPPLAPHSPQERWKPLEEDSQKFVQAEVVSAQATVGMAFRPHASAFPRAPGRANAPLPAPLPAVVQSPPQEHLADVFGAGGIARDGGIHPGCLRPRRGQAPRHHPLGRAAHG